MKILRASLLALALLVGALALPGAATSAVPAAAGRTRVIADCAHRTVEPRKVVITCGDGNIYVTVRTYGSWKARWALGQGRLHINDCRPSCAGGTFHSYPATFRFHRVVRTAHGRLFTRLGVTYVKGGEQRNREYALPRRPL